MTKEMSLKVLVFVCIQQKEAVYYSPETQAFCIKLNTEKKIKSILASQKFVSRMALINCAAVEFSLLVSGSHL